MNMFCIYLSLEVKKALKKLPHLLLGAVVLLCLVGTVAFCAAKLLYQGKIVGRIPVGVVMDRSDEVSTLVVSMLASLDSVSGLCDFVYLSEETAMDRLEREELAAVLLVPIDFAVSIMNGTNSSIIVMLPQNMGLSSVLVKELTDSGAGILGAAQAGIYAAGEFCVMNRMYDSLQEIEYDLNKIYMDYAISRDRYFKNKQVSSTGDMSIGAHYLSSCSVLFLMLCGIPCVVLLKRDPKALRQKLKIAGIGNCKAVFAKILSLTVLLSMVMVILGGVGYGIWFAYSGSVLDITAGSLWALLIVVITASSFIVFAYEVTGGPAEGMAFLFLGTVCMIFLSGGFLPVSFLPEAVGNVASRMPTAVMMRQMGSVVTGEWMPAVSAELAVMVILLYGFSVAVRR